MSERDPSMRPDPSPSIDQQAEAWLARLNAPDCGPDDRRRFQHWLAQHPAHWQAYHRAEQLWAAAARVQDPALLALAERLASPRRKPSRRLRWLAGLGAAAAVAAVAVGLVAGGWFAPAPAATTYATAIGEIRAFTLPDDSVITLDTDTVVQVRMGRRTRAIALQRGQARFTVAHDARRPFVVATSMAQVVALGTVFQVRRRDEATVVDLLEGRVRVEPVVDDRSRTAGQVLSAGERLSAYADRPWTIATIDPAAADGWLSGRLVFDAMPLKEAVETFNRYSRRKLRIDDPTVASIPIDGVFNAGDTDSIVLALQYAYPLRAEERGGEVILHRKSD